MNKRLRHRLVGALVLLALAVIFIPEFLDGQKVTYDDQQTVIPVEPELNKTALNLPEQQPATEAQTPDKAPADVAPPPQKKSKPIAKSEPTNAKAAPATVAGQSVVKDDDSAANPAPEGFKDNAWVIQLGGFRNADNVARLVKQVQKAGYTCFTRPATPVKGQITRVYVGPSLDKKALAAKQDALKKLTGLAGKIYPYDPANNG